ncbi:hypothetical protein ARMGADRAFT_317934 [Armillaria gallica]|uniref:Uncharacterized protein n=1 Tax=Armillaria gallica TaxID=47427 RepID=A0A2H3DNK6_ARMGA|nr:hypothetical protein ARMGADRAFT_317934 [Armillaria gallica]
MTRLHSFSVCSSIVTVPSIHSRLQAVLTAYPSIILDYHGPKMHPIPRSSKSPKAFAIINKIFHYRSTYMVCIFYILLTVNKQCNAELQHSVRRQKKRTSRQAQRGTLNYRRNKCRKTMRFLDTCGNARMNEGKKTCMANKKMTSHP